MRKLLTSLLVIMGLMGMRGLAQQDPPKALVTGLMGATEGLKFLWEVAKSVVFAIGESFMFLGRIIKDAFTFNWSDIGPAWTALQQRAMAEDFSWQTSVRRYEEMYRRALGRRERRSPTSKSPKAA